jgi:hypothetical protein
MVSVSGLDGHRNEQTPLIVVVAGARKPGTGTDRIVVAPKEQNAVSISDKAPAGANRKGGTRFNPADQSAQTARHGTAIACACGITIRTDAAKAYIPGA